MPRKRYYRKRPGYRAFIDDLWRTILPFMEPDLREPPDLSGLQSDGLSSRHIEELQAILAEFGLLFRSGLNADRLPEVPPDFFALGAEMPAPRWGAPTPRLRRFLQPQGRVHKVASRPLRPSQQDVDAWMLARAQVAFARGEPTLKEASVVPECVATITASRMQARVAFSRLPRFLRRRRGQHDRWTTHPAADPDP